MSKKANPTVIGGFVLGAVVLVVAAVLVFGGGQFFVEKARAVLFFPGSVSGLGIGAPVVVRGVKIGQVADVSMEMDLENLSVQIPVIIEFDQTRMKLLRGSQAKPGENLKRWIEKGLRGQLAMQSFVTGQLMVSLELHPDTPARLTGLSKELPEIPTIPTPFEELSETIQELPLRQIVERTSTALEGISKTVNSPEIAASMAAVKESLKEIENLVRDVRQGIRPVLDKADQTLGDAQKLVQNVDSRVSSLSKSAEGTLEDTRTLVRRVDGKVDPLATRLDDTLRDTQTLLRRVDGRVDPVADRLDGTLRDAQGLLRRVDGEIAPVLASVKEAARDAEKLIRDTGENLGPALKSFRGASDAATAAMEQATKTLGTLQGAVAADSPLGHEIANALGEISAATRSLRVLAEYLEGHPDAVLRGKTEMGGR